jgi:hypothetical protein
MSVKTLWLDCGMGLEMKYTQQTKELSFRDEATSGWNDGQLAFPFPMAKRSDLLIYHYNKHNTARPRAKMQFSLLPTLHTSIRRPAHRKTHALPNHDDQHKHDEEETGERPSLDGERCRAVQEGLEAVQRERWSTRSRSCREEDTESKVAARNKNKKEREVQGTDQLAKFPLGPLINENHTTKTHALIYLFPESTIISATFFSPSPPLAAFPIPGPIPIPPPAPFIP